MKARMGWLAACVSVVSLAHAQQHDGTLTPQAALGVTAFTLQELGLPGEGWKAFEVGVRLGERDVRIRFAPHSVRSKDFRVLADAGGGVLVPAAAPAETTYRGSIDGEPGAVVAGSLVNGRLKAMVRLGGASGGTWNIQPLADVMPGAPASSHIVSRDSDAAPGPWTCGVTDKPRPVAARTGSAHAGGPDAFLACQIACDADYEYYVANGSSVGNTTTDIESVINGMASIYQADANVTFVLGTLIVRQAASQPYTSSNAGTLLDQFRQEWGATQGGTVRDVAHLFTGKELDGSTVGLAYIGVLCSNTFGYGLNQSRYTANFSYRVGVISHEVGHNFNEGHCDSACSPCRIMCSGLGGCSGVVTSFGCSAPTLAAYAAGRVCLTPFNNGLTPPFADTFTSLTLDYNRWPTPSNSGAAVSTAAVNERSAPNSLDIAGTSAITGAGIDLTGVGNRRVFVTFWSQHRTVEAGETLAVTYRRPVQGDFQPLVTLTSTGTDQVQFTPTQVVLPTDGHGANAAIRFTAQGNQGDDHWYIDDVRVSLYCRADLNEDGRLNIFDFQAYQAGLATLNTSVCDWNGDGFITVLDFNGFFAAVTAGCAGY